MSKRPIYYDTETTGIRPEKDRIVEIAAFDPVLDKTFVELVKPGIPIPKEASSVHGITDEMVGSASTFAEVGARFAAFCDGEAVLIAHNNDNFDKYFLREEAARHSLTFPDWPMIDTLKWARRYRPDLPRHSLQFLRHIFGIEENNAHRALDDVVVLYKVFSAMIDDLSIDTVLDLLENAPVPTPEVMPFGKYKGQPLSAVPPDYIAWLKKQGALDKPENAPLLEAFAKLKSS
ncbi:MAG: DNA polymerase III PolC-type [Chlamydiae bacterium]|nr:DNA polymerase III PolC-type [Chlamydiota bacterium]